MQILIGVFLSAALWCLGHSFFITHRWQHFQMRHWPGFAPWSRLTYVLFNSLSLGLILLWWHSLSQTILFSWPGPWAWLRWSGLGLAGVFFLLGAQAFDNRAFLGVRQLADHLRGRSPQPVPFHRRGILSRVRHPWYSGSLLFFIFCLPVTDVNLVWRAVFMLYTLIGTVLEERKLVRELGPVYEQYQKDVNRFWPLP